LTDSLRVIFAGTPEFAAVALLQIKAAGFDVVLVLTQPDRPAGRGLKLQASAVKQLALRHGIPVAQPRSLRLEGKFPEDAAVARDAIVAARADIMVVAAYGLILPQWVLDTPRLGCLNIHGSLLPRWRGAAPIHRAIEAGDVETGITIMQMDAGLDTGDMLLIEKLPIADTDTTGQLHDKLAAMGGKMIVQTLLLAIKGELHPVKQPEAGITYAHKIEKHEAVIDWSQSASQIVRRVHAFNPFPGANTTLGGEVFKIWGATVSSDVPPQNAEVGQVLAVMPESIVVSAMNSAVNLIELQRPGGKRLSAADLLRGFEIKPGMWFAQNFAADKNESSSL
jgi:methionyl-tRNA formyltransferase